MDTQQNTALTRALAEVPGPLPCSGVIHIAIPHTTRFTVVGNHLAQHADLSCAAVGIAVRIQSLPPGSNVGIKALAARCREGEKRVAAALHELETHGYLQRARVRLPNGRIVTRTVFCNQPTALLHPRPATTPQQPAVPASVPTATPRPTPTVDPAPASELREPEPKPQRSPVGTAPAPTPGPAPGPASEAPTPAPPAPASGLGPPAVPFVPPLPPVPSMPLVPLVPPPTASKPPPRPLPRPTELTPELDRVATALLSDLRRHAPQFVLSEASIRHLVPGVAAWLERSAHPDTIRHTLTNDPPQPLRHPVKLIRHRLTALLPPPLPDSRDLVAPSRPRIAVTPFQTCDGCDRAFRSPIPGECRDCRDCRAESVPTAA